MSFNSPYISLSTPFKKFYLHFGRGQNTFWIKVASDNLIDVLDKRKSIITKYRARIWESEGCTELYPTYMPLIQKNCNPTNKRYQ